MADKTTDSRAPRPAGTVPHPEKWWSKFHHLWTKAVGTADYVKAEWVELEGVLLAAGTVPHPEKWWSKFHHLWTKAVGTADYVKAEWVELEGVLLAAGTVPSPPPPQEEMQENDDDALSRGRSLNVDSPTGSPRSPQPDSSPRWQPIETHDGTSMPVLTAEQDGYVAEAWFSEDRQTWWELNSCDDGSPGSDRRVTPTHWMPLPEPPQAAAAVARIGGGDPGPPPRVEESSSASGHPAVSAAPPPAEMGRIGLGLQDLPIGPIDQRISADSTERLINRLLQMSDEQNTRQQAVYTASDIRDAVEREDVLRSAAALIRQSAVPAVSAAPPPASDSRQPLDARAHAGDGDSAQRELLPGTDKP